MIRNRSLTHLAISFASFCFVIASPCFGGTYYVSPTGLDTNNGAFETPFRTIPKAITTAIAGDTIYLRGHAGCFALSSTLSIAKSGSAALPFKLFAYPGESPILDFAPETGTMRGVQLNGNFWHIQGLTIQNAKDNGIHIGGSNNILERLITRNNGDSGVQISNTGALTPSNNLVLNVDSYLNYDPANNGENADGFAVKFRQLGPGNVLRGCRAWSNSDDGYDFWQAQTGVTVENCWAWKNGINVFGSASFQGDGNGIKLGHDSGTHVLKNFVAWGHPANGIDVNGNATQLEGDPPTITHGVQVVNSTAYNNSSRNFRFDESFSHLVRNNLSAQGSITMDAGVIHDHNTWNGLAVGTSSFISLDDTIAIGPRLADGSLPISGFLRLKPGIVAIDSGVNVGLPFTGAAPDLGAFEVGLPLAGDTNFDNIVDITDLGTLASHWQANGDWTGGDFDFNGFVDITDLGMLATNWQATASISNALASVGLSNAGVPEPAGFLAGTAMLLALGSRRAARKQNRHM